MSTAARKARKRAGIPLVKKPKVPTPPEQRSYVTAPVPGTPGTKFSGTAQPRSAKKVERFLERFTPATPVENS
jgi:hypothetical protein